MTPKSTDTLHIHAHAHRVVMLSLATMKQTHSSKRNPTWQCSPTIAIVQATETNRHHQLEYSWSPYSDPALKCTHLELKSGTPGFRTHCQLKALYYERHSIKLIEVMQPPDALSQGICLGRLKIHNRIQPKECNYSKSMDPNKLMNYLKNNSNNYLKKLNKTQENTHR